MVPSTDRFLQNYTKLLAIWLHRGCMTDKSSLGSWYSMAVTVNGNRECCYVLYVWFGSAVKQLELNFYVAWVAARNDFS